MKYILLIALIIVSGNVNASVEKFAVADSLLSVYKSVHADVSSVCRKANYTVKS